MLRRPWVIRDVEAFPHLEVDAPLLPDLSVGSEGSIGPTDSVIISNWADFCLSKGGRGARLRNIYQG